MAVWRPARPDEDDAVVAMSLALYEHDPPAGHVGDAQVRRTLARFRAEPQRGRALVLDSDGRPIGYAFLVSFWSNELGGEICTIDELFVVESERGRGYGTMLLQALRSDAPPWPARPVALELEVSPDNVQALALYERHGFRVKRNSTLRVVLEA